MNFTPLTCTLWAAFTFLATSIPSSADEIWTSGVTKTSGWYDANKVGDTDTGMCWAASSSNMINWLQNQIGTLPAGTPTATRDQTYTDNAVWQAFRTSWTNEGASQIVGLSWWLTGKAYNGPDTVVPTEWSTCTLATKTTPTYYQGTSLAGGPTDITYTFVQDPTTKEYSMSTSKGAEDRIYHMIWTTYTGATSSELLSTLLTAYAHKCCFGITIAPPTGTRHNITLWGIEYSGTTLSKLWVTDSDDTRDQTDPTVKYSARLYDIDVITKQETSTASDGSTVTTDVLHLRSSDQYVKDVLNDTNDYRLTAVTGLSAEFNFSVPEPGVALLSLLSLFGLIGREK